MTDIDIDAIRQRAQAATPGPWQWYGNTDVHNIYLSSTRWGRQIVMDFERWGMNSAQPSFVEGRTWKPDPESTFDFAATGSLTRARDIAVYEVAPRATTRKDPAVYRADIRGLRNPDAVFIAAARQDVDTLLAKVDELTAALTKSREQAATYANEVGNLTAENARVRQQRDEKAAELELARPVVEAAKELTYFRTTIAATFGGVGEDFITAVDALPKAEATR